MSVKVKLLASLSERFGVRETEIQANVPMTVEQVWGRVTGGAPMLLNTLTAINLEYCERDARVNDGDEVAFFPPVTGG